MRKTTPLDVRFWRKVDRSPGPDSCWPWTGAVADTGYGKFQAGTGRAATKIVRAPRLSWELTNGREIPLGMEIRHKCDNRICVNPGHLEPGTRGENMKDMYSRGRQGDRWSRGAQNPKTSLTETQVKEIRRMSAEGQKGAAIARALGAKRPAVYNVIYGVTWTHLA